MKARSCLLVLLVLVMAPRAFAGPQPKRILILHWFGVDALFRTTLDASLIAALRDADPSAELYIESLEGDRFGEAHLVSMRSYLGSKYAGRDLDVVIAVTDSVVSFLQTEGKGLFGDAPVVYLVTRRAASGGAVRMTGVAATGITGNELALIDRLQPDLREIIVVDGMFQNAGILESELRRQSQALSRRVRLTYLRDRALANVVTIVSQAPAGSAVVYVRQHLRTPTEALSPLQGLTEILRASRAPVYSIVDAHMGQGVLGGYVSDFRENAKKVAHIAIRVAEGASVADIPPVPAAFVPMFDWRQMKRWGIAESRLPQGSIVLFRPHGLWAEYGRYALAATGVVSAQFLTIGFLLVLKKRRARAESALRTSEARNTAILRTMPDLMFILSPEGVYLDYYAKDPRDLFVQPAQFLGKRIRDIFPHELADRFERSLGEAAASDEPVVCEYSIPLPDGERHYEARMLHCDNDTIMTIVRDVTARHQSEEHLHHAQTELASAVRMRALGEMAAGIAHEVNQPISAIMMNTQICLKEVDRPQAAMAVREVLQDIASDVARAANIIRRIRGMFSHAPLRKGLVCVNDIVNDVVTLSDRMLRGRGIRLRLDLASPLTGVMGDRIQLQQVLLNLILNGVDAMHDNETDSRLLAITTAQTSGGVTISVADSGRGVTEAIQRRMFLPFFTTKADGMGMGLSISRSIVESHGGRLRLVHSSGQGATFQLELPDAASESRVERLRSPLQETER